MAAPPEILEAARSGRPVRVHTADGEVLVARVLGCEGDALLYAPLTSSHPERYAVCDSTGFSLPFRSITRVKLLGEREVRG